MKQIKQKNAARKNPYFLRFLTQFEKFAKRLRPDLIDE